MNERSCCSTTTLVFGVVSLDLVHSDRVSSSVQFSRSVVSDSLRPHGLWHRRLPCPSPTPGLYSNSCPLSEWCHPAISSSVVPFSSPLLPFQASGFFPMRVLHIRWPKYWSYSFSIIPSNEYSGMISFRMNCLDLLAVQGTVKNLLYNHSSKASILRRSAFFAVQLPHPYMTTGKTIPISWRIFQFVVNHTVKGFGIVNNCTHLTW